MATILDSALDLAARGFRVFPLQPYGKKPAIGQFNELATTDRAQINEWWKINPVYNIGVATTDMVVADVDTKKGEHALENYIKLGGHYDTFVVRTASGGIHAYFEGPNSKQGVNILPSVDTRSSGGYVVGPGSYLDPERANDATVRFAGRYTIAVDKPLTWVPVQLELKLVPPHTKTARVGHIEQDLPGSIAAAAVWLEGEPPAIEGMGGDNQTYTVCAKIVRDFALSDETAYQVLLDWNERCVPPWPTDELWAKVQNAEQYATASEGQSTPAATFANVQILQPPNPMERHEQGFYLGNAKLPKQTRERQWVAYKLLMRGDVSLLAAAGAGGKSLLMLAVCAHFALGLDFGPYQLKYKRQHRIMIYNAEDDIEEQSRRLQAVCLMYRLDYALVSANIMLMDDSLGDLIVVSLVNNTLTPNKVVLDYLIDTAVSEQLDIIVADPLINIHTLRENDNGDMRYLISQMRRVAREADVAMWLAQHTNKGATKLEKGDADAIRGGGALVNSSRLAILMTPPDDQDISRNGLDPKHKYQYVRLDDAKTNFFAKENDASLWLKWESQRIVSGDVIGVLTPYDMKDKMKRQYDDIALSCFKAMTEAGVGKMGRMEAIRSICALDPLLQKTYDSQGGQARLRNKLDAALTVPRKLDNGATIAVVTEGKEVYVLLT